MISFRNSLQHARTRPAADCYAAISEELQVQIGKVVSGESTPEQAVDDALEKRDIQISSIHLTGACI